MFVLATILISTIFSGEIISWLQLGGLIYLTIVMLSFKLILWQTIDLKGSERIFARIFWYLGLYLFISSIIGISLWFMGYDSPLIQHRSSYLYFGEIFRAQSTTGDPNILTSPLTTCLIISTAGLLEKELQKKMILHSIVIYTGLLLTLSKTCLLSFLNILRILKTSSILKRLLE